MSRSAADIFKEAAAKPVKAKRRRRAPFSIRLSDDERAKLERKAGKRSLGSYARAKLLGDDQQPRRTAAAKPSIDYALLGQALGKLGKSEQVSCLFLLLVAAEENRVTVSEKDRAALHDACTGVREMRAALMGALGLRDDSS